MLHVDVGGEAEAVHVVCASLWVLLVIKWWVHLVALLWVLQLQALVRFYSARPEEAEEPDDGDAEHGLPLVAPPPPPRRGARQGRVARTVDRWRRAPRRWSRP